jgi:parvulin-like peptidyl-prolyl isomerase
MRRLRLLFVVPVAVIALVAAGCGGGGGGGSVPDNAVATVGGDTVTKAQFDQVIAQAKRGYEKQRRKFPSPGTPEYETLKSQAVEFLVQRAEFEQAADKMGITVNDKQVDDRIAQLKKQYFKGNDAKFKQQIAAQGYTLAEVEDNVRAQLLSEELFNQVTKDAKVSNAEVEKYYKDHASQYRTPESRDVRHILVKQKSLADRLYRRLHGGANFAQLAKQYSQDPGSKAQGGKLTVAKGQTVPPFDKVAFALKTGSTSQPVKTRFGWHIIRPISDTKRAHVTPLSQVRESIRQTLLQQKKNEEMNRWVEDTKKDFKVSYQTGFQPQTAQKQ